jgi:predicted dehydrogenase
MTVRVGVLGVAGMGLLHVLLLPKAEGAEVAAICDVVPDALEKAGGGAPDAKLFSDPAEMFASGTIDAVVIASPNALHAAHVTAALEAGLHVYCEKPLGITVGECRAIAELAADRNLKVQVGFQHRFQHHYATAHKIITSGEIGDIFRASMFANDWFRPTAYFGERAWRASWAAAGGGVLMLQAIHQLDAFLWMCGMPSRVTARAWSTRPEIEIEDDLSAMLEFGNGARGVLTASTIDPAGTNRLEITGDRGTVVAHGDRLKIGRAETSITELMAGARDPFARVPIEWSEIEPDGLPTSFNRCVGATHADFIDAIVTDRDPLIDATQATMAVEVTNAVYLSAALGEPVQLPLDAGRYDDAFAKLVAGTYRLPEHA